QLAGPRAPRPRARGRLRGRLRPALRAGGRPPGDRASSQGFGPSGPRGSTMLWVLLPAYNEEASLPALVPKIARVCNDAGIEYRILVGDDGSRDRTAAVLEELQASYPIQVLRHRINRGLGETSRDL